MSHRAIAFSSPSSITRTGDRGHGTTSFDVRPEELRGLSLSQLSSYNGPARFQLVRDAGTFNFEGELRDGARDRLLHLHAGFRGSRSSSLRAVTSGPPPTSSTGWRCTTSATRCSTSCARSRYERPSVDQLVVMGMHGANLDYMKSTQCRRISRRQTRIGS